MMADMSARISSLEKSLIKARDEAAAARSLLRHTDEQAPSTRPRTAGRLLAGADVFVHNGASSQYFNEILFAKFIEGVSSSFQIDF